MILGPVLAAQVEVDVTPGSVASSLEAITSMLGQLDQQMGASRMLEHPCTQACAPLTFSSTLPPPPHPSDAAPIAPPPPPPGRRTCHVSAPLCTTAMTGKISGCPLTSALASAHQSWQGFPHFTPRVRLPHLRR